MTFNLNHEAAYDAGLICGGTLEIFVEPILPQPMLYLFGGGHVSTAVARVAHQAELQRMCAELRIPSDFDIAQISWRPDYDPFFYDQLSRRARRIYLFRGEYIFDLEKAVVVETPQLGHATYVFAKPRSMDSFLVLYTKITKEDIRRNRDNASERLGFLGRIIHGTNPRAWLQEMCQRLGEKVDFAPAMAPLSPRCSGSQTKCDW